MKKIFFLPIFILFLSCNIKNKDNSKNKNNLEKLGASNYNEPEITLRYKLLIKKNNFNLKCLDEKLLSCQTLLPLFKKAREYEIKDSIKTNRIIVMTINNYTSDTINYSLEVFKMYKSDTIKCANPGIYKHKFDCNYITKAICTVINK